MAPQLDRYAVRRQEIRDRLDAIHERLDALALACAAAQPGLFPAGQVSDATFQVAAEEWEAQATASLMRSFYWAARAHDQAAQTHERAAAGTAGEVAEHQRRAAFHRAAAADDERRAAG